MEFTRRDFLRTAIAVPVGSALAHYEALAAPLLGEVKITAIKTVRMKPKLGSSGGLIKIETDAGLVGYGPGGGGPEARAAIDRLGALGPVGKDPLQIRVHFHNMFYANPQRERPVRLYSGIDMALWDLAGKILNKPVSRLLGGNFRDEILTYAHLLPPRPGQPNDYLSKEGWRDKAKELQGYAGGFRAFKIDIHPALGIQGYVHAPSIGPAEARRVHQVFTLAREAFDPDVDFIVHCHNELDVASAIRVAKAVESIDPLYYEDPLSPLFSESWTALRRSTTLPILTGENIELIEQAMPFLQNQAVDCLQPDLINSGGITGTKIIADVAASYRTPIALHNVSGYALNLASQQFAASVFNCPRIECRSWFAEAPEAAGNIPVVKNGKMKVATLPGLGIVLNDDYMKANLADGEPWWG
jgi:L-alanine-DL-glutamate epimerase-like enolase superfamily enzyme